MVLKIARRKEAKWLAAVAAGGLVLSPAIAATSAKKKPAAVSLSFDPMSSFTPANADPKLAAQFAGKGLALTDFKFTPAPAKGHHKGRDDRVEPQPPDRKHPVIYAEGLKERQSVPAYIETAVPIEKPRLRLLDNAGSESKILVFSSFSTFSGLGFSALTKLS